MELFESKTGVVKYHPSTVMTTYMCEFCGWRFTFEDFPRYSYSAFLPPEGMVCEKCGRKSEFLT